MSEKELDANSQPPAAEPGAAAADAEANARDHRKIGQQLELFAFDEESPGMPYWLPKGLIIFNSLLAFWREEHEARGYQEIASPLLNKKSLFETSGHWEHYVDNMFLVPVSDTVTYALKPMNCPNAMKVFNFRNRSYRELPLRLSDCDPLHRKESSGALHGLLRVQRFHQDDAHIFVSPDQIEDEYDRILDIADRFYGIFNLKYSFRLGTRPKDGFMGEVETWDLAEASLKKILDKHAGAGNYEIADGDGAFYGPKIDIVMEDSMGRKWQTGTIQLDFQLPLRFQCEYIDRDGKFKTPVVIHRVIYGSLERFIGILLEHTGGALPVWLSPVQVKIVPIADRHFEYAEQVASELKSERLRVEIDYSGERMQNKIRRAQVEKVPYMLVVGDRESNEKTVSARLRTEENLGGMPVAAFLARVKKAIADKSSL
jgi:threonyl-tRNA synthetase